MLPQILATALRSAGGDGQESVLQALCFLLIWVSLFIILGQVLCPGATCSLRPPGCWSSLENPEADGHLRSPSHCDSAGRAWGLGKKRTPCVLFCGTQLQKRVSAQLAACMEPLPWTITEQSRD